MHSDIGRTIPLILGHRGASISHPENTLEAFAAAIAAGADGVELDVRRSADDVLVVHHDAHLVDGRMVRDVAAADLPATVPSLAEALISVHDAFVNIEIKNSPSDSDHDAEMGVSAAVAALVAGLGGYERRLVSAFELDSVLRIQAIDPGIAIGWLTMARDDPGSIIDHAAAHGLQAINPNDRQVDRAFVALAHDAGLKVFVWTVDSAPRALQLAEFGVDGIITNDPFGLVEAFR